MLIHVAAIYRKKYLFLRKNSEGLFHWFRVAQGFESEEATGIQADSCSQALFLGRRTWAADHFRLLHCGTRYSLPERDQVGSNALFWQMALSYNSPNGRYFDEEVGHLCFVDEPSQEALEIWRKIRSVRPLDTTSA